MNRPVARFKTHSVEQARARTVLTEVQILEIIAGRHYIPLGQEQGTTRVHKLFYSPPDEYWFVAVHDEGDGELVTILPVEYENRFKVAQGALDKARHVANGCNLDALPERKRSESMYPAFAEVQTFDGVRRVVKIGKIYTELTIRGAILSKEIRCELEGRARRTISPCEELLCIYLDGNLRFESFLPEELACETKEAMS